MQLCRIYMKTKEYLMKRNIRVTEGRIRILSMFLNTKSALSEKEIQDKLSNYCDRATIYRTLKTFAEKEIIHIVATDNNTSKFILKKEPAEHLHFKCTDCGSIECLPEVQVDEYDLPQGYKKKDANLLIIGTCNECNE